MRKLLLVLLLICGGANAEPGADGVTGQTRHPLSEAKQAKKRAVVFFFVTTDCPIANRFAPEINKIIHDYEKKQVAFFVVQTDKALKASQAMEHAKQYSFSCPVLLDRKRELVKFCGASATPEAALLSPDGKLLYRGRIDDRYAGLRQPRAQPTRRDLRLALDAVLAGKPVAIARTKAVGCYIED
jgi:peroxiredoxin